MFQSGGNFLLSILALLGEETGGRGDFGSDGAGIEQTDAVEAQVASENLKKRPLPGKKVHQLEDVSGIPGVRIDRSVEEALSQSSASLPDSLEASTTPWPPTTSREVDEGKRGGARRDSVNAQ